MIHIHYTITTLPWKARFAHLFIATVTLNEGNGHQKWYIV